MEVTKRQQGLTAMPNSSSGSQIEQRKIKKEKDRIPYVKTKEEQSKS